VTAQTGLTKLSHATAIAYEKFYELLYPSIPSKEYPANGEEMKQGRQLLRDALDIWGQVNTEADNLLESFMQ